ncbi:Arc family DNA binding domain-containing protein [Pedobacter helvus]|uniref:Arc family DNA binding domain-containing protein n=1 Tax=Pedobacter helvus TaxID=2563444 RepID=A0ABW9JJ31_9SPHI|nr:Arc family DNA binding domain-containing protein [Pedobacter ureilyticus]
MSDKEKKAFALRINPALLKEIERWAVDEFRSTNGQIEYILNEAVKSRNRKSIKKDNDTTSQ